MYRVNCDFAGRYSRHGAKQRTNLEIAALIGLDFFHRFAVTVDHRFDLVVRL